MSTRKKIQRVEVITGSPSMNPPRVMTKEEMTHYRVLILAALAHKSDAPRNGEHIVDLHTDTMSEGRKQFMEMIERIAQRQRNAPPLPVPPLVLSHPGTPCHAASAIIANEPEVPLHELLRQTKLLILKATRNER